MYKCYDCGYIFDEPENFSEDKTPGGVFEGGSFIEHCIGCPRCSGAYGEIKECDNCNEFVYLPDLILTDDGEICDNCYNELYGGD